MQTYTVKVIGEQEWADLVQAEPRYEHVTEDNLGFADPAKRRAYVRAELLKDFPGAKALTLQHEFEHLVEDRGTDEDEHGVRHKKFFKQVALPILGGLGGALLGGPLGAGLGIGATAGGIAGAGLGGFGGAKLGGASTRQSLVSGGLAAGGQGLFGGLGGGKGLLGGIGKATTNPLLPPPNPQVTQSTSSSGASGNFVSRLFGGGQGTALSPISQTESKALTGFGYGNRIAPITEGIAAPAGAGGLFQTGSRSGPLASFGVGKSLLGPVALGAGIAGLGQFAGPTRPDVPELGQLPSINQFRTDASNQLSPLAARLQGLSNTPLPSALESPIRRQFENQRRQLYSQYAAAQPGVSLADTGPGSYQSAYNDLAQREAESIANAQLGFQGNERQNILAQLGVDERQLGFMQDLAQLDIDTIMARTGLKAQEAMQFKQTFGQLGGGVAGAGILGSFMGR